jgi:hypothetical protein
VSKLSVRCVGSVIGYLVNPWFSSDWTEVIYLTSEHKSVSVCRFCTVELSCNVTKGTEYFVSS